MIIEKLNQMKEIHQQQKELANKEKEMVKPILTDLEQIPVLYKWFCIILKSMDLPPYIETVTQRKKFLFIILYLYSPGTLNGKPMVHGLRKKLVQTLEFASATTISDNCTDLIVFYSNFKEYREEIDVIYKKICERMIHKGWVVDKDSSGKSPDMSGGW